LILLVFTCFYLVLLDKKRLTNLMIIRICHKSLVERLTQYVPRGHGIGLGRKRRGLAVHIFKILIYIIILV